MSRSLAAVLVSCVLLVGVSLADVKILKMKDGSTVTGDVTETKDSYQVAVKPGLVVVYAKSDVAEVQTVGTAAQEFDKRMAAAADANTADAYFAVADWAYNAKQFDKAKQTELAKQALDAALKIDSKHAKSIYLLRQIQASGAVGPVGPGPVNPAGPTTQPKTVLPIDRLLISDSDIQKIRRAELREKGDEKVSVLFRNGVLQKFIEANKANLDASFRRLSPAGQAYQIIHDPAANPQTLVDVMITSDPQFMSDFRSRVWPKVRQTCANINCHGGEKPTGTLKFARGGAYPDRVEYTNFVILVSYSYKGDKLIDRSNRANSLLLNYLLPPDQSQAQSHHKQKIPNMFKSADDKEYKDIFDWITNLSYPPVPEYHLEWRPPAPLKLEGLETGPAVPTVPGPGTTSRPGPTVPTPPPTPPKTKTGK